EDVRLEVPGALVPGKPLVVRGRLPARLAGAQGRLTLERSPNSQPTGLVTLPREQPARDWAMKANHERASLLAVVEAEVAAGGTAFEAKLAVPAKLPWPRLVLRAYAWTKHAEGLAVRRLEVGRPAR